MVIPPNDNALDVAGERGRVDGVASTQRAHGGMMFGVLVQRAGAEGFTRGVRDVVRAHDFRGSAVEADEAGGQVRAQKCTGGETGATTRYTVTGWLLFLNSMGGQATSSG